VVPSLISQYKIRETLSEGAIGMRIKGEDLGLKRPVALKFPRSHMNATRYMELYGIGLPSSLTRSRS